MKRVLSVLLCIGLLFGACSFGVVAENGIQETYTFFALDEQLTALAVYSGHVAQGESYSPDAIAGYTASVADFSEYGFGDSYEYEGITYYEAYSVPADVFEAEMALHFALDEELLTAIRESALGLYDEETEELAPLYDADADAYVFSDIYGEGDCNDYYTYGYVKTGNQYEVYVYDLNWYYEWTDDAVPGEDYIFVEDSLGGIYPCEILGYAKFMIEYDDVNVKFLWSEEIDELSAIDNMVVRDPLEAVVDGDFAYVTVDGGEALWAVTYGGNSKNVTVPATVNDLPVTGLMGTVFAGNQSVKSVTLPEGLTYIGDAAFGFCTKLSTVNIPAGVEYIGDAAFAFTAIQAVTIPAATEYVGTGAFLLCEDLTAIDVAAENELYTAVDGVLFDKEKTTVLCYPMGKEAESYAVPDGVTALADGAFAGVIALTEITLPQGLTSMGTSALAATGIASITIPEGVTTLSESLLQSCEDLTEITLPSTLTEIGVMALAGTGITGITIPAGVTTIGNDAFWGAALTSVDIPEGVTTIGDMAFADCEDLTVVSLPSTLQELGLYAFSGAPLETVTYNGSRADWARVQCYLDEEEEALPLVFLGGSWLGDVDGNGKVNTTDARLTLQYAAGRIDENALDVSVADVDDNGKVNTTDARLILQKAANRIDAFPAEK